MAGTVSGPARFEIWETVKNPWAPAYLPCWVGLLEVAPAKFSLLTDLWSEAITCVGAGPLLLAEILAGGRPPAPECSIGLRTGLSRPNSLELRCQHRGGRQGRSEGVGELGLDGVGGREGDVVRAGLAQDLQYWEDSHPEAFPRVLSGMVLGQVRFPVPEMRRVRESCLDSLLTVRSVARRLWTCGAAR